MPRDVQHELMGEGMLLRNRAVDLFEGVAMVAASEMSTRKVPSGGIAAKPGGAAAGPFSRAGAQGPQPCLAPRSSGWCPR